MEILKRYLQTARYYRQLGNVRAAACLLNMIADLRRAA